MTKSKQIPDLVEEDLFEEKATDCGCQHKTEQVTESTTEEFSPKCLPWVKIERDPNKFNTCLEEAKKIGVIDDSKKLFDLIKGYMIKEDQEVLYVILLDTQLYLRGIAEVSKGARDRTLTPIPDILRLPLVDGATAFFIAHNHPSGKSDPSEADKKFTKELKKAANTIGIPLFDHIIVGANEYYSFADNKEI